jgi:ketosteroid isomerase-like protein
MTTLEARVDALTRRVQALEDDLAIHRLIVSYGLAVDTGDAAGAAATFADDGVYDVDVGAMHGQAAVAAMIRADRHQAMVGRCAHQIGPAVVEVRGDTATAVGYSRVYLATEGTLEIYRVSTNRWDLARRDGTWRVVRRITRLLGRTDTLMPFEGAATTQMP